MLSIFTTTDAQDEENAIVLERYASILKDEVKVPSSIHEDTVLKIDTETRKGLIESLANVEALIKHPGPVALDILVRIANFKYLTGAATSAMKNLDTLLTWDKGNPYAWNTRGLILYMNLNKPEDALKCFDEALNAYPQYFIALTNKSFIQYNMGAIKEALTNLDIVLRKNASDYRAMALKGIILLDMGSEKEASTYILKALSLKSNGILPLMAKAQLLEHRRDLDGALGVYREISSLLSSRPHVKGMRHMVLFKTARMMFEKGELREALGDIEVILKENPRHTEALKLKGLILNDLDDYEGAVRAFAMSVVRAEDKGYFWYSKALTAFLKGNYTSCLDSLRRAIFSDPKEVRFIHLMAFGFLKDGRIEEAFKYANKALEVGPMYFKAWHLKGLVLEAMGAKERALASYKTALKYNPEYRPALDRFLALVLSTKSYKAAEGIIEDAVKRFHDDMVIHKIAGDIYLNLGDRERAVKEYRHVINTSSDPGILAEILEAMGDDLPEDVALKTAQIVLEKDSNNLQALKLMGRHLEDSERPHEAKEYYLKYINLGGTDEDVLYSLGCIYEAMGEFNEAINIYNQMLHRNPKSTLAHFGLGVVYESMESLDEAVKHYKTVLEIERNDLDTMFNLAYVYVTMERYEDALGMFNSILEIDPENEEALEARAALLTEIMM